MFFGPADAASRSSRIHPPTVLFAPDYGSPQDCDQHRPHQTIQPLARRLQVPIRTPVPKGREKDLVEQHILTAVDADVLVCWDHQHIGEILAALGDGLSVTPAVTDSATAPWPDDRFDLVLVLDRVDRPGAGYRFSQLPQQLLDGDSAQPLHPTGEDEARPRE